MVGWLKNDPFRSFRFVIVVLHRPGFRPRLRRPLLRVLRAPGALQEGLHLHARRPLRARRGPKKIGVGSEFVVQNVGL